MWEWIQTWTFFNWLSLIAFAFLPFSALNAVLGLKSRWKDWRALKSKDDFEKRIIELEKQIYKIAEYKESPINFLFDSIEFAVFPLISMIAAFILVIGALSSYISKLPIGPVIETELLTAVLLMFVPIFFLIEIQQRILYFKNPDLLIVPLASLIKEGSKKDFVTKKNF